MKFSTVAVLAVVAPLAAGFAPVSKNVAFAPRTAIQASGYIDLDEPVKKGKKSKAAPAPEPVPVPVPAPAPAPKGRAKKEVKRRSQPQLQPQLQRRRRR